MMLYISIIVTVLTLLISCDHHNSPCIPVIDYYLVITDTIGVDVGNAECLIGLPAQTLFTPEGNVAILDMIKNQISFFTTEGDFISSVGGEGEGPGEFIRVNSFSFYPDGGFLVSDANCLSWFDYHHDIVDKLLFYGPNPFVLAVLLDSTIIGYESRSLFTDNGPVVEMTYGHYSKHGELVSEFTRTSILLSPPDADGSVHSSAENTVYSCASDDGSFFISRGSTTEFLISCYLLDGTNFLNICDDDFERIKKTDDEIEYEIEKFRSIWSTLSGNSELPIEYHPDPYKDAIVNLFVDHQQRLWVQLGYYSDLIFRVYDMNGEILFHVKFEFPGNVTSFNTWETIGDEHGFLSFDSQPEYESKVYVLKLIEADHGIE